MESTLCFIVAWARTGKVCGLTFFMFIASWLMEKLWPWFALMKMGVHLFSQPSCAFSCAFTVKRALSFVKEGLDDQGLEALHGGAAVRGHAAQAVDEVLPGDVAVARRQPHVARGVPEDAGA